MTKSEDGSRAWALFFARGVLGLLFFMAGVYKVFQMGATEHARRLFVEAYADTFLPAWSLWATGTAIPWIELVAGGLLLLGLFVRPAGIALGWVLLIVTFGHLLKEPFYESHVHVLPRLVLLVFVLAMPVAADRLSLDAWIGRLRRGSPA